MCQNYAKAELKKIQRYDAQIDMMLSEVSRIRSLAMKVTATISGDVGGGGGNSDKIADAVARIVDLEREIDNQIDEFVNLKKRLMNYINQLQEPNHITILHRRYFLGEPFWKIAEDMGYCERNIGYLHGNALLQLNKLMKGETEADAD